MKNIYLVGHMGAGKTTIGQYLAEELNLNFVDTDLNLERMYQMPVSDIFQSRGEQEFRVYETAALLQTTLVSSTIVSTGGGILVRPRNGFYMKNAGVVIYLQLSVDSQLNRLTINDQLKTRPLVANAKDKDELKQILTNLHEARNPAYEYFADYVIEADNRSVKEIVNEIVEFLAYNHLIRTNLFSSYRSTPPKRDYKTHRQDTNPYAKQRGVPRKDSGIE